MTTRASATSQQATSVADLVAALAPFGARLSGAGSVLVTGLSQDSRRLRAGEVFAARRGEAFDGTRFIPAAVERGAAAILIERGTLLPNVELPIIEVQDIERAIAAGAEAAFGFPSRALALVGITGTNGKTTVSVLCSHAIEATGEKPARLGTLGYSFQGEELETGLTTPEADEVSRSLARARAGGATHFVMETSSHALAQARVDALRFQVAAFTNLTQDHLDYHHSLEEYYAAKLRLFTDLGARTAVVNVDDAHGRLIAAAAPGRVLRVSRFEQNPAEVRARDVELSARGIGACIELPSGSVVVRTPLVGEHNLENVLITMAVVEALGLDIEAAARALARPSLVPGRFERCDGPADDIVVLVDYAHTPDALRRALSAVRGFGAGSLTCVFGCGGDRDRDKRSKMGEAVACLADRAIITNDNPRSEDPELIAAAIRKGIQGGALRYDVVLDRAAAIERAVLEARPGDVVLIAGKGHETYQIIGRERHHFDDRQQARGALAKRRAQGVAG